MAKKEELNVEENTRDKFVIVLSLISIFGFMGIISRNLFNYNMDNYIEMLWMLILGAGLLLETKLKRLKSMKKGLNDDNFPHLTNALIGLLAVIAGILSIPQFGFESPVFNAIKGILSVIAISAIIIETWVIKHER